MKKLLKVLFVCMCAAFIAGSAWAAPEAMTDQEKRSYALGDNVGRNLKQQGLDLDPALVSQGLVDAMGGKSRLTEAEVTAIVQQIQKEVRQKQEADRQKKAAENQQRGTAFLGEYAKREGVMSLGKGLYYKVLQAGNGDIPVDDNIVLCNYRGTLVDGTVFDASQSGKPSSFKVSEVIPGWRRALRQMPVGSKWELVIPAGMAYGERGAAPAIGPNETLIFEVELVGIEE